MTQDPRGPYRSAPFTAPAAPPSHRRRIAIGLIAMLGVAIGLERTRLLRDPSASASAPRKAVAAAPSPARPLPTVRPSDGPSPTVALRGVVALLEHAQHGNPCARTRDRGVFCWGPGDSDLAEPYRSTHGLNAPTTIARQDPVFGDLALPEDTQYAVVAAQSACGLTADRRVFCSEIVEERTGPGPSPRYGRPAEIIALRGARQLAGYGRVLCAVSAREEALCWSGSRFHHGTLTEGPFLGRGIVREDPRPAAVAGLRAIESLALGSEHARAVDRAGRAFCWGAHDHGMRGDLDPSDWPSPRSAVPGLSEVVELAAHHWSTCARTRKGEVYCWGYGSNGLVGPGARCHEIRTPQRVPLPLPATEITLTGMHACALLDDGSAWCWGRTAAAPNGCEGDARRIETLAGLRQIRPVGDCTCALDQHDRIDCWCGIQIDGRPTERTPGALEMPGVVSLGSSMTSTVCGLDRAEAPQCRSYVNGAPFEPPASLPQRNVAQIVLGPSDLFVVTTDGVLHAARRGPEEGLPNVAEVVTSERFNCARHRDGTVSCWGNNTAGELGRSGGALDAPSPVLVRAPR